MAILAPSPASVDDDFSAAFLNSDSFQFIEEKACFGVWSWDVDSRKMEWSDGLFRLLGLRPGSVVPSYALFQKIVDPHDHPPLGDIDRLSSEGGAFKSEFRIRQRDGRVRWLINRGEFLLDGEDKRARAKGVVVDATRLHDVQSALKVLQQRYCGLTEAVSALVWTVNASGIQGDVQSWCEFTGQTPEELSDFGWLDVVHPDDRNELEQAWTSAVSRLSPFEFEYRLRRVDGAYRWVRARAVPLFKKDKTLREWLGVCVDIQDHKVWSTQNRTSAITGAQLRAARGIVNWSVRDLANSAGISPSTIRRLEEINGPPAQPEEALMVLRTCLERAGVEFLFPPLGKPAVRPL